MLSYVIFCFFLFFESNIIGISVNKFEFEFNKYVFYYFCLVNDFLFLELKVVGWGSYVLYLYNVWNFVLIFLYK